MPQAVQEKTEAIDLTQVINQDVPNREKVLAAMQKIQKSGDFVSVDLDAVIRYVNEDLPKLDPANYHDTESSLKQLIIGDERDLGPLTADGDAEDKYGKGVSDNTLTELNEVRKNLATDKAMLLVLNAAFG